LIAILTGAIAIQRQVKKQKEWLKRKISQQLKQIECLAILINDSF
jgi:hypothetical protein